MTLFVLVVVLARNAARTGTSSSTTDTRYGDSGTSTTSSFSDGPDPRLYDAGNCDTDNGQDAGGNDCDAGGDSGGGDGGGDGGGGGD